MIHVAFTGRAQLLMKYLSLNILNILIITIFTRIITVRSETIINLLSLQANFIKNQRKNRPLNAHRISEPSLSTKCKNGSLMAAQTLTIITHITSIFI